MINVRKSNIVSPTNSPFSSWLQPPFPPLAILPFHLFRPYSSIHSFFHIIFLSPFTSLLSRSRLSSIPLLFLPLYLLHSHLYIYRHHLTLYLLSISSVSPENPSQSPSFYSQLLSFYLFYHLSIFYYLYFNCYLLHLIYVPYSLPLISYTYSLSSSLFLFLKF